ncbi:MAG: hypothetical protein GY804_07965 [Alphaproteobacteria bacterium]|nr:hypothetical protein [Alphaproteobacteria bacterium]
MTTKKLLLFLLFCFVFMLGANSFAADDIKEKESKNSESGWFASEAERKSFEKTVEQTKKIYNNVKIVSKEKGKVVWNKATKSSNASAWVKGQHAKVRLVLTNSHTNNLETGLYGVEIDLENDWKIYWKNPGDAGYPPEFSWKGSENIKKTEVLWPVPVRFSTGPFNSIGYFSSVIFPVNVTVNEADKVIKFKLHVDFMTCNKTCIPESIDINFDVPAGNGIPSSTATSLRLAAASIPSAENQYFEIKSSYVVKNPETGIFDTLRTKIKRNSVLRKFAAPDLFIESDDEIVFNPPTVRKADRKTIVLESIADKDTLPENGLIGAKLDLTFTDVNTGIVKKIIAQKPTDKEQDRITSLSLYVIFLAILGGFILNFMPCVLPVIYLKLIRLVQFRGEEAQKIRRNFYATSLGIVSSFLVIAVLVVALKFAGATVGWGFQFQSPLFITFMIVILILFAASMWGVLEVQLPSKLSNLIASKVSSDEVKNSFLEGAFATLLAMPCSAPFLGTAIGFALSKGFVEIFVIFAAVGVGMALPFALVALFPVTASLMPKPGKWMSILRIALGVTLTLTAMWLLTVLSAQVGPEKAYYVAGVMSFALLVLIAAKIVNHYKMMGIEKIKVFYVAVFAVAASFIIVSLPIDFDVEQNLNLKKHSESFTQAVWQKFDANKISSLVKEGKVVFVDITADWCITCKLNKWNVLDSKGFLKNAKSEKIILMRADYTNANAEITKFIASFDRSGVPFNVIFGPKYPIGFVLPSVLNGKKVLYNIQAAFDASTSAYNVKKEEVLLKSLAQAADIKRKKRLGQMEIDVKAGLAPSNSPDEAFMKAIKDAYAMLPKKDSDKVDDGKVKGDAVVELKSNLTPKLVKKNLQKPSKDGEKSTDELFDEY